MIINSESEEDIFPDNSKIIGDLKITTFKNTEEKPYKCSNGIKESDQTFIPPGGPS